MLEAETVQRRIHCPDDRGRRVVRVEHGGARGTQFVRFKQSGQFLLLGAPLRSVGRRGEHLWQSAPADILRDDGFFLRRRGPGFRLNLPERADGREILPILLLQSALADPVGVRDPVVARVERTYFARSAGRRMYFSLTSSQA